MLNVGGRWLTREVSKRRTRLVARYKIAAKMRNLSFEGHSCALLAYIVVDEVSCTVRVTIHGRNINGALKGKDLKRRLEGNSRCHRCCYQIGRTKSFLYEDNGTVGQRIRNHSP
ncbi:hypothetical protein PILCRDRAFT_306615 [Piloderma croceum F 1598]|uniref:Uncharacterized protein n=1 Tax=Piloderma croceum (strain F 1598) TaxID=765440 RepID=A0A0C3G770_PILCF|nr:hypothetical protein PILCRDRAFT_306615 [Piloderma croceum F 1598]